MRANWGTLAPTRINRGPGLAGQRAVTRSPGVTLAGPFEEQKTAHGLPESRARGSPPPEPASERPAPSAKHRPGDSEADALFDQVEGQRLIERFWRAAEKADKKQHNPADKQHDATDAQRRSRSPGRHSSRMLGIEAH